LAQRLVGCSQNLFARRRHLVEKRHHHRSIAATSTDIEWPIGCR
jgi:hypothetical protein